MYAVRLSVAHLGQREEGDKILRELLQRKPSAASVHQALGEVLAMKGEYERYESVAADFSQALQLDPKLPLGHYHLGLALLQQSTDC